MKKVSTSKIPLPNSLDITCGNVNIGNMWKTHFNSIFNNIPPADYNSKVFGDFSHTDIAPVTGDEVKNSYQGSTFKKVSWT